MHHEPTWPGLIKETVNNMQFATQIKNVTKKTEHICRTNKNAIQFCSQICHHTHTTTESELDNTSWNVTGQERMRARALSN